LLAKKTAKRIL